MKQIFFALTTLLFVMGGGFWAQAQKPRLIVPIGHTRPLTEVVFTPDGTLAATAAEDALIKLWDARTGELIHTFQGHQREVTSLAFSADGSRLVSGGRDGLVIIWDSTNGELLHGMKGHQLLVYDVAFSPDGKQVASGSGDKSVRLWNVETGEEAFVLEQHTDYVKTVCYSPSGKQLLSAGGDGSPRVWDPANGRLLHRLSGHTDDIEAALFSPKGDKILTAGRDKTARLWDTASGSAGPVLEGHTATVHTLAFSSSGSRLATGGADNTIRIWDSEGSLLHELTGHTGQVNSLAFSADGTILASGSSDRFIRFWDSLTGKIRAAQEAHTAPVVTLAFAAETNRLLSGSLDQTALIWDAEKPAVVHRLVGYTRAVHDLTISDKREWLMVGSDGRGQLWDLGLGMLVRNFPGTEDKLTSVAIAPDGQRLLQAGSKTATLWNPARKAIEHTFEGHRRKIEAAAFTPDGQVVTAGDGRVQFYDARTAQTKGSLTGHRSGFVRALAVSPDGRRVLTGSDDKTAILWDAEGKQLLAEFKGHADDVRAVAFSPAGDRILTGSWDKTARVWSEEGTLLAEFVKHGSRVNAVAFSPDGEMVATASADGTAIIWDSSTGEDLEILRGHTAQLTSLAFSPDGQFLLTGSLDNTIRIWDAYSGFLQATLLAVGEKDWVVTSPRGLFDASPGAMRLMHYVVSYKGKWEVIELDQLKARYYEPGLLAKVLKYADERIRPVERLDSVSLYPNIDLQLQGDSLRVRLLERNGGIGQASIFVNGKEIITDANPAGRVGGVRDSVFAISLDTFSNYFLRRPGSVNQISVRVTNAEGWLRSREVALSYPPQAGTRGIAAPGATTWTGEYDPKLFVISLGTANYSGSKLRLKYADKDAEAMATAMLAVGSTLFRTNGDSLEIHCLTTNELQQPILEAKGIPWYFSNKENIKKVFDDIRTRAKAEDVIMIYMSGHGVSYGSAEQTQFHYLTQGIATTDLSDVYTRQAYTISSEEFTDWINDIPALKQVLVIDACNSGQLIQNMMSGQKAANSSQVRALDRMKDRTGMYILSGSASNMVSYEASQYGQGLLTYALLEGMRGKSIRRIGTDNTIDVMTLFQYASDRVPELAANIRGIQTPMLGFPGNGASFDLGLFNEELQIPSEKPILIRSTFLDRETFDDSQDLMRLMEEELAEESEEGDFIYVDVNEYPGAYSIRGLYSLKASGEIEVEVRLLRSGRAPVVLNIPASSTPKAIVNKIIRAMKSHLERP